MQSLSSWPPIPLPLPYCSKLRRHIDKIVMKYNICVLKSKLFFTRSCANMSAETKIQCWYPSSSSSSSSWSSRWASEARRHRSGAHQDLDHHSTFPLHERRSQRACIQHGAHGISLLSADEENFNHRPGTRHLEPTLGFANCICILCCWICFCLAFDPALL